MREKRSDGSPATGVAPTSGVRQVPHDERAFFDSFYKASVRGEPLDRMTIGPISDPEARFHYNCVENSIIRVLFRRSEPPRGATIEAWRMLQQREQRRLLDVGSGTGHWIDFFREVFFVAEVVALEIAVQMVDCLRRKYAGNSAVRVLDADIAAADFGSDLIGGPVDWITAIGVMFHIVDDARWHRAITNLAGVLKPGGLLFVGGDFGAHTRNVQFHRSDRFDNWREFATATGVAGEVRVNKRVRSLAMWHEAANQSGLRIVDLVRSDHDSLIMTPENDLLVLQRGES
jgi:SAM-dependent methyltransferase